MHVRTYMYIHARTYMILIATVDFCYGDPIIHLLIGDTLIFTPYTNEALADFLNPEFTIMRAYGIILHVYTAHITSLMSNSLT